MPATSTCVSPLCHTTVEGSVKTCPKCGKRMQSSRGVRLFGWVLTIIGGLLAAGAGYLRLALARIAEHPGQTVDGMTFSGTAEQGQAMLSLIGGMFGFGVFSLAYGIWMIVTGRRSLVMVALGLVAAAGVYYLARQASASL